MIEVKILMFKVGEIVRNVAANVVGAVVETDGDTVYLEQSNGCDESRLLRCAHLPRFLVR